MAAIILQPSVDQMQPLIDPVVGLRHLAGMLRDDGDVCGPGLDGPLPGIPIGDRGSWRDNVVALARGEGLNASRPAPPAIASRLPAGARVNDPLRLRAIHRGARSRAPAADVA